MSFHIINDFDKPCAKLVVFRENGVGRYLSGVDAMAFTDFSESNNLVDFGFDITHVSNGWIFEKVRESVATYIGGKTREWQGAKHFVLMRSML